MKKLIILFGVFACVVLGIMGAMAPKTTSSTTSTASTNAAGTSGATSAASMANQSQVEKAAEVPANPQPAKEAEKPAESPVALSGSGIMKTKPFHLNGGSYSLIWKASDKGGEYSMGCYHGGFLKPVKESLLGTEMIGNEMVNASETKTGETQLYNVKSGDYYLDMTSGCNWEVTIKPQE